MSELKTQLEELNSKVLSQLVDCLLTKEGEWKNFENVEVLEGFVLRISRYINEETRKIIEELGLEDE